MFLKSTIPILILFAKFFGVLLALVFVALIPFLLSCLFFLIYFRVKGLKFKKRTYQNTFKNRSIFARLFFDFPRRFVLDRLQAGGAPVSDLPEPRPPFPRERGWRRWRSNAALAAGTAVQRARQYCRRR